MSLTFTATAGGIQAHAADRELAVLRAVPGFLSTVADEDSGRLQRRDRPPVFADEQADHEFRRLTEADVDDARSRDRDVLEEVLGRLGEGAADLSITDAEAVVRALGTARIALAARNGLLDLEELPTEPSSPQQMLVAFLGMVQEELVEALTDVLPAAP